MAGIKKTRKAARKRVTKRRRSGLKIKSTAKKLLRRMFRMRGGMEFARTAGVINKLAYCACSVVVSPTKVLYLQKYPPAGGAFAPVADKVSSHDELAFDNVSKDTFTDFWFSPASYQANGKWKGGAWGGNNFPTTDESWLSGIFIRDEVHITPILRGIVKYSGGKSFTVDMPIIGGSEGAAWTVNVEYNGQIYGAYLTDNIMPQFANDVLFVWENLDGRQYVKLLTRGNARSVDMPQRMMPGAGEHLEPGVDVKVKSSVLRAVQEEIGVPDSTLTNAYLLRLGTYDTPGRDPRYWTFNWNDVSTGENVNFGLRRGSSSQGYVIYLKSDTNVAPEEVEPGDTIEVNRKWWANLQTVLADFPDERWMIVDHKKFIPNTLAAIDEFKAKEPSQQEAMKLSVA